MENIPVVLIVDGKLSIEAFTCALGQIAAAEIDLTPFAGERVRIWLDADGQFSTDKRKDHYWQIAEVDVPAQTYRDIEGEPDSEGRATVQREAVPIDFANVEVLVWELPE